MNLPEKNITIQQKLDYLYALDGKGIKPGLKRILEFLDRIGNPQKQLTTIHVAGTNGKGSTCAILASVLSASGLKVGLYTSPHLVHFNERIRINGKKISDTEIVEFLDRYQPIIEEVDSTFFETTTALAFEYFNKNKVDIAILETGLGGRYDATNVVNPLLSVITSIGKDHEEFLGNTLAKIAMEKAGIIKSGTPVISAKQRPQLRRILENEAQRNRCHFVYAPDWCQIKVRRQYSDRQLVTIESDHFHFDELKFPFLGDHQLINLKTVMAVLNNLQSLQINPAAVEKGIAATRWHGRLELLSRNPLVYYDVGHNLHGIRQVAQTLEKTFPEKKFKLLIALGYHKKIGSLGKILSKIIAEVVVSEIPGARSIPAITLAAIMKRDLPAVTISVEPDLRLSLQRIMKSLGAKDRLLILGSHYFAPAIYDFFKINV
ncbi:bifunctional folylpolyglutamate synthase/dihydrofolate synthase [bacterium]|nr:bifunctional folylpolyglutamate synthase/dihydrofolate synthase [bacterium]MBU1633587.1 bifunctional folylpolyglutamate synthase/dihydrofolate synthase [bacterium]MBU1873569.1 bifunctional folylpolyglutamate synthase/dihydrofolate synthase [bacterium]